MHGPDIMHGHFLLKYHTLKSNDFLLIAKWRPQHKKTNTLKWRHRKFLLLWTGAHCKLTQVNRSRIFQARFFAAYNNERLMKSTLLSKLSFTLSFVRLIYVCFNTLKSSRWSCTVSCCMGFNYLIAIFKSVTIADNRNAKISIKVNNFIL